MDENVFISDTLQATREGRVDPQAVVSDWVDDLASVLEFDELTADEAFTLLATREKLRRVRPSLLDNEETKRLMTLADQRINSQARPLLEQALSLPNPQAWRQNLERLDASFEEETDPLDQSLLAAQLIDELDDAQLLLVAAGRFGLRDEELQTQLEECEEDLVARADLFYGATLHVQSIGQSLRTDLDDRDYDLAATTLKFIHLLEAAERIEAELGFENITPLHPDVVQALYRKMQAERGFTQPQMIFSKLMNKYRHDLEQLPAAAAAARESIESPQQFVWTSPDGSHFARMILPAKATRADEEIRIGLFRTADQRPLTEWVGKALRLGSLRLPIEVNGIARLSLEQLTQIAEPWRLSLEPDHEEWRLNEANESPDRRRRSSIDMQGLTNTATMFDEPGHRLSAFHASQAASKFGPLARWCLDPEVLSQAREDQTVTPSVAKHWVPARQCPQEPGGCLVVFAKQESQTYLRSAFVLPLRWCRRRGDHPHLPPALRELAEQVRNDLSDESSLRTAEWALDWSTELGDVIFPNLRLDASSGWAALAAGLLVAAGGGKVRPDVWASARWGSGIQPVADLDRKLNLAREFGVRTFFVPESQVNEAQEIVQRLRADITIGALPQDKPKPREALKQYLRELRVPPTIHDPKEVRRAYYLSPDIDPREASRFYLENLVSDIIDQCRCHLAKTTFSAPTVLVTIASDNPELVILGIEVLRPSRCLVLYTQDKSDVWASARQMAKENSAGCQLQEHSFDDLEHLRARMAEVIRKFIAGHAPNSVIFDLTPGPKDISFTWMLEIAPPGSSFYYLKHSIAQHVRRVDPFSEKPVVWRKDDRFLKPDASRP